MIKTSELNIIQEAYQRLVAKRKKDQVLPSKEKLLDIYQSYQFQQNPSDESVRGGKFIHFTTKKSAALIYTPNSEAR